MKNKAALITEANMIATGWFHHPGAGVPGVPATSAKTRADVESYVSQVLTPVEIEELRPAPDTWRWRAEFTRNPQ